MNQPSVVVCVTDQQSCVRLIHEGSRISVENSLPLYVLSVVPLKVAPRSCGEALEYLFSASREAGAEMTVFYHCDVLSTALSFTVSGFDFSSRAYICFAKGFITPEKN